MNQPTQPAISSYNMLPFFKTNKILYLFSFIIVVMIIGMFMILYNVKLPSNVPSMDKTNEQITYNVLIVMFILIFIIAISIKLLPESYNLVNFFSQIKWVGFILIYVIGLILFFRLVPKESLDKHAFIITPLTILLTAFMFYKSMKLDYILTFNINYERIKLLILFFCLITICIVYYSVDPGKYIKEYYGYSLLLTIVFKMNI